MSTPSPGAARQSNPESDLEDHRALIEGFVDGGPATQLAFDPDRPEHDASSSAPDSGELLGVASVLADDARSVRYLGVDNTLEEWTSLSAAAASGRPYVVRLRPGLLVLDVDGSPEALELLARAAAEFQLPPPVASREHGLEDGHGHLIVNAGPIAAGVLQAAWADIAEAARVQYGCGIDVRIGGRDNAWLRPPASPHRSGQPGELPTDWGPLKLAATWRRGAASPQLAARLVARLCVELGLERRWSMRMAAAAYPPSPTRGDPLARYQAALQATPNGRGLNSPAEEGSAEMVSLRAVTAGLEARLPHDRIAADLVASPAGAKATTRASGRARAKPLRWARLEVRRLADRHTVSTSEKAVPVDNWKQRIDAMADTVRVWSEAVLAEAMGHPCPDRRQRITATMGELLRRVRGVDEHQRADQVTVEASLRSLGRAISRHRSTADRALDDLTQMGVIAVEKGDSKTNRPSRITVDLSHDLLANQQVRQGSSTHPPKGVSPGRGTLSHVGVDTLLRHDAWALVSVGGVWVSEGLGVARGVWEWVRVRGARAEELAAGLGRRVETVEDYLERLAVAELVVQDAEGRWQVAGDGLLARLDAAARAQGTMGAGLSAALWHAIETADARCWMPDDLRAPGGLPARGEPTADEGEWSPLPPMPPPPAEAPGGEYRGGPAGEASQLVLEAQEQPPVPEHPGLSMSEPPAWR